MGIYNVKKYLLAFLNAELIPEIKNQATIHGLDEGYIIEPTNITEHFVDSADLHLVHIVYNIFETEYILGDLGEVACDVTQIHNVNLRLIVTDSDKQRVSDTLDIWSDAVFQIIIDDNTLGENVRQTLLRNVDFSDFIIADESNVIKRQAVVSLSIKER